MKSNDKIREIGNRDLTPVIKSNESQKRSLGDSKAKRVSPQGKGNSSTH
jgi:hypothetical protein